MTEKKILILGATGMLGSIIYRYFTYNYLGEIWGTARTPISNKRIVYFDSSNLSSLDDIVVKVKPEYIINCIGSIPQMKPSISEYYRNNFDLPARIIEKHKDVTLVQPSTDCVFTGNRKLETKANLYSNEELSTYRATDSYGLSKSTFDAIYGDRAVVLRCSIIGPGIEKKSGGLFDWVASNRNNTVTGFTDHYWNGNTTLEFSKIAANLVRNGNKEFGIYTLGNAEILSKAELLHKISTTFSLNVTVSNQATGKIVDKTLQVSPKVTPLSKQLVELEQWCKEQKVIV